MANRFGIDVAGDVRQHFAHDEAGDAAGELDDLDAAVHLGPGFGQRLAVLARDQGGQLFEVLLQQRAEAEHQPGPLDDRRFAPSRQRGGGRFDHLPGLLGRGERHAGDHSGRSTD